MFDIQNYASFVATIILFQLIPGAGTLAIVNASIRGGYRGGLGAVAGTLLGDFLYMLAAVLGLAAIIQTYPDIFQILQWLGAGYLCWLGIRFIIRSPDNEASANRPLANGWLYFRQAFMVCLANPKAILFFLVLFPLFIRPDASASTFAVMIAHVALISFLYQLTLVLAGNAIARRLSALPWAHRVVSRLAGLFLIGFGIRLAADIR